MVSVMFDYDKFPAGHQDMLVTVVGDSRVVGQVAAGDDYPVEWEQKGCAAVSVPLVDPLSELDAIRIYIDVGPNYERAVYDETFSFGG